MKYIPPKFDKLADMAAIDVGRLTEDEARTILENIRRPQGPAEDCESATGAQLTDVYMERVLA